jgi:hypothetical protein
MQAIRDVAGRCAAAPDADSPGVNAVIAAGLPLGDDSLELTAQLSLPDQNAYMGADVVVIRSGQDLIVVAQRALTDGGLDPATNRLLAAAAYAAYQRQP